MSKLLVYSADWCPDCRVLKAFLDKEAVCYEEVNLEKIPEAAGELVAATGKRGIPYMRFGDQWIKGYPMDAKSFRKILSDLSLI
jgi:glutaredoxin